MKFHIRTLNDSVLKKKRTECKYNPVQNLHSIQVHYL